MQQTSLVRAFTLVFVCVTGLVPAGAHAVLIGTLEQVNPIPTTYTFGTDFRTFSDNGNAATGDVEALIQAVDISSGSSGCEAADFAGFSPGAIALVERGTCVFSIKANNAAAAGALGILIFDNSASFPGGQMVDLTTIPALFLTDTLGADLVAITAPLTMHMTVTRVVPEPTTSLLVGIALVTLALLRRRARSLT